MRWIFAIIIYTLMAVIGVTFKRYFGDFIFFPDLIAVSIFCFCFFFDSQRDFVKSKDIYCLIYGLLGGLIYDCFSLNMFGESLLPYGVIAILASMSIKKSWTVFALSLFLYFMVFLMRFFIYKDFSFYYLITSFFVAVANALAYWMIEKRFLKRKRRRRLIY